MLIKYNCRRRYKIIMILLEMVLSIKTKLVIL